MGQMGKFESKEKTQKKGHVERKGCFFECLIFLFGVVVVVLLNIPDDSLSGLEVFDIGVIALFLICSVCTGVYKTIRKRKNKKRTPSGEGGTANAVTDVGRFERFSPNQSKTKDP